MLVNFWATWCVPCREEYPDLTRLEKAYRGKGLSVLGVSIDSARDLAAVDKFLAKMKPDFPNYRKASGGDDQDFIESVDKDWGGELPFTVLYARDGKKAKVLSGKQTYGDFETAVKALLPVGSPLRSPASHFQDRPSRGSDGLSQRSVKRPYTRPGPGFANVRCRVEKTSANRR